MKWSDEAESALKKVPSSVRKRVCSQVEKEAVENGRKTVTLADLRSNRDRFSDRKGAQVNGYRIDTCFGKNGCPKRTCIGDGLMERVEAFMKGEDLLGFLKQQVKGDLKFHHEFRITLADCPNACSQPQIKDIGIIGALTPAVTDASCSRCEGCVAICREDAVTLEMEKGGPQIHLQRCLACGQCIGACPTGTLSEGERGFRVQLGGKLGRHPQLARELPGIFNEDEVLEIVRDCVAFYKKNSTRGRRFARIFRKSDFEDFSRRFGH